IFVMFGAAALLIGSLRQVWTLFIIAGLALGYIAYEINVLYVLNGRLDIHRNGYGGLDNNGAGLMLAMGVPICYFAWGGAAGKLRWLFLGLLPILLHAVLMTYSRGAMVSLMLASPLVVLRSRHRVGVGIVGAGLLLLLPVLAGPEIRARFLTIAEHGNDE